MKYILEDNYGNEYGQVFDTEQQAQQESDYLNSEAEREGEDIRFFVVPA